MINTKELVDFFELKEGYDIKEIIDEVVDETGLLKHESLGNHTISTDECSIHWVDDSICCLEEFLNKYTDLFLKKIVNVIESFDDN